MKYYSTEEISKKWHISSHRIAILAKEKRIKGAMLIGNRWMIPENADKPIDARYKKNKDESIDGFRFPLLINGDENDYTPSLTSEEKILRQAQIDFNACRFKESKKNFIDLSKSKNPYIRITSIIHLCLIAIVDVEYDKYVEYQLTLNMLLSNNLKYKNEILLMKYVFDVIMGIPKELLKDFNIDNSYDYHSSSLDMLTALSIFTIVNGDISSISKLRLDPFVALSQKLMNDKKYFEAQLLHLQLTYSYYMKADKQKAIYHMKKMIELARDYNLIYLVSVNVTYLPEIFNAVKDEFDKVLIKKINHFAQVGHIGYMGLIKKLGKQTFYTSLSSKEYKYVYLASQGYSNKQIAKAMDTSEFYVSKRLSEIYHKLNINGKSELSNIFESTNL